MVYQLADQKDQLRFQHKLEEDGFVEVTVLDLDGSMLYNFSDFLKKGEYMHQIHCEKGFAKPYLLRVAKDGNSTLKKVLINA